MPIFLSLVLGVLHSFWFDFERVIDSPEYVATHMYKDWQYRVFYIVMAIMSLFEFSIVYFYIRNGKSKINIIFKLIIACIAVIVWCSIAAFFIATTPYVKPFDWM
jgi:hypothetical protein